ncbi:MAG: helix-turn-helix transcriptional regulator [Huintestinicola sp.]
MKIDRLIGILSILLQKQRVTAAGLADKFEVSVRTIYRDIEAICRAGIPIAAERGTNGGIYIMDGFRIDSTLLSTEDMCAILAGLKSLDSVCESKKYRQLMDKLYADGADSQGTIVIDLSMWDKTSVAPKLELIKDAIEGCQLISFTYYSPERTEERRIEPYRLIYQWSSWYVWGYCLDRKAMRLFKLSRMTGLEDMHIPFEKRDIPEYTCDKLRHTKGEIEAEVKFDKSVKWRIIDEFGAELPRYDEEGNVYLNFTWEDVPSFFRYILTFGDCAEIISPAKYREEFSKLLKNISHKYDTQLSD